MIGTFRKFSSSIYAKILLGIIVIPFVFWGMGNTFFSGNKNVIVSIDKEKYSIEEFTRFIQKFSESGQKITNERINCNCKDFRAFYFRITHGYHEFALDIFPCSHLTSSVNIRF